MLHRLLIVIDEAANVAPMPALRRHVSEGRGLGVNFVVAVQASSQLDTVYGSAYAHELRDTFPAALIMFGAAEMDMLRRAEEWTLQTTRRAETFDQASGAKTLSPHLGSTLDYRRLLPENRDHARLLLRGTAGRRTEIPDWTTFVGLYDRAVHEALGGGTASRRAPQNLREWLAQRHQRALAVTRGAG
jgi:hypothetical protein